MVTATVLERAGDQLGEFLPRFGGALLLLIAGLILAAVLGRVVRSALIRVGLDRLVERWGVPEMLAQALVVVLFGLCAAAQVGVALAPLTAIFGITLAAVAVTLALAFGLGSREIARALTAARYARADFATGQTIRVGDLRGTIEQIDSAATTLRAGSERIRIPNHVLIEAVVIVEDSEPAS